MPIVFDGIGFSARNARLFNLQNTPAFLFLNGDGDGRGPCPVLQFPFHVDVGGRLERQEFAVNVAVEEGESGLREKDLGEGGG